jgi:hypothetical protein
MRDTYRRAHREARINRREGRFMHNPVRITDGYPGLWVEASGQVVKLHAAWTRGGVDGYLWEPAR